MNLRVLSSKFIRRLCDRAWLKVGTPVLLDKNLILVILPLSLLLYLKDEDLIQPTNFYKTKTRY